MRLVLFEDRPLRDLMVEAIRYGNRPDVRARLTRVVDHALDRQQLQALLEERALAHEVMDKVRVYQIREEMERAEARRLQPHFIAAFFLEALKRLGGRYYERETGRYEITHVPATIRNRGMLHGGRKPLQARYERVVFEKRLITVQGRPPAALLCPGHPLLDALIDLLLEQHRDLLTRGTVLVDQGDAGQDMRMLFYLEHTIQDASSDANGKRRVVSRQLQFIEIDAQGVIHQAGYAPFLDYRPLHEHEQLLLPQLCSAPWLTANLEKQARDYAITQLVPRHLSEVKARREAQIDKTYKAVNERLTKEIIYWDSRAEQLRAQEAAGKVNARLNSQLARQRAEELYTRLDSRLAELEQERNLSKLPPVVMGGVLIVPQGLLDTLTGSDGNSAGAQFARETRHIEQAAMAAVMRIEQQLGYIPRDVSAAKCGYDIESRVPNTGKLRFIEVKGRIRGATTVTVTKNEILTALNKPDDFILAIVQVEANETEKSEKTETHHQGFCHFDRERMLHENRP